MIVGAHLPPIHQTCTCLLLLHQSVWLFCRTHHQNIMFYRLSVNQLVRNTVHPGGKWLTPKSAPDGVVLCWTFGAHNGRFTRRILPWNWTRIQNPILFHVPFIWIVNPICSLYFQRIKKGTQVGWVNSHHWVTTLHL